jgi:hypothetical protein
VTSFAGSGEAKYADGPAQRASFVLPFGVAQHEGRVFVADTGAFRIRTVECHGPLATACTHSLLSSQSSRFVQCSSKRSPSQQLAAQVLLQRVRGRALLRARKLPAALCSELSGLVAFFDAAEHCRIKH